MSRVKKGVVAGFAATVAVSLLELANIMLGPWAVSFPRLLSVMFQSPDNLAVGWIAHFVVGTLILGPAFSILCPRLPSDTAESKGILFAVGAFVIMGLTVAPMVGIVGERPVGIFFMQAGFGTFAWMIVTHAVFGLVLGNVYGRLAGHSKEGHDLIYGTNGHHRHGPYHA